MYVEIKQHTLKQPVCQKGNHKGNLKILGDRRRKRLPLQYSCQEIPGAWWATVCGAAKSWT